MRNQIEETKLNLVFLQKNSPVYDDYTVHASQSKEEKGLEGVNRLWTVLLQLHLLFWGLEKESCLGKEKKESFVVKVLGEWVVDVGWGTEYDERREEASEEERHEEGDVLCYSISKCFLGVWGGWSFEPQSKTKEEQKDCHMRVCALSSTQSRFERVTKREREGRERKWVRSVRSSQPPRSQSVRQAVGQSVITPLSIQFLISWLFLGSFVFRFLFSTQFDTLSPLLHSVINLAAHLPFFVVSRQSNVPRPPAAHNPPTLYFVFSWRYSIAPRV